MRLFLPHPQGPRSGARNRASQRQALIFLTVLGIVFRSELAILLGTHTLYFLVKQRLTLQDVVSSGVKGILIGLVLTVPIDSFFWQQFPSWPEFISFYFNVMEGKSSDWGTSPFHYYITNALPKLLLNPMAYALCLPFGLTVPAFQPSSHDVIIPNVAFILIYSIQPHKEWRFIIYSIPPLTTICARGAAYIWDRRHKSRKIGMLSLVLVLSTLLSLSFSFMFLIISSLNYPGAVALSYLHAFHSRSFLQQSSSTVAVHMDILTCQTGATLFLQYPPQGVSGRPNLNWTYDKTDSKTGDGTAVLRPDFWAQFDYALAEQPAKVIGHWDVLDTVYGYGGVQLVRPGHTWGFDSESERAWEASSQPAGRDAGRRGWGDGPWTLLGRTCRTEWVRMGMWVRKWVTRGWWIDVRMVPMIKILRKARAGNMEPNPGARIARF